MVLVDVSSRDLDRGLGLSVEGSYPASDWINVMVAWQGQVGGKRERDSSG